MRALGGEATTSSTITSVYSGSMHLDGNPIEEGKTSTCRESQRQSYAGAQVGADFARLNLDGWNIHLGGMAGYVGSRINDDALYTTAAVQAPFFGTYLMVSKGRFFADFMVRRDSYNFNLNSPAVVQGDANGRGAVNGYDLYNLPISAHGIGISANAGYNFDAGNGWSIEPSAGFVYSNTSVDRYVDPGSGPSIQYQADTNRIESALGRLSLRVAKSVETSNAIWQPFVTASVIHEFAGDVVSNTATFENMDVIARNTTTTSRVGTYGQYSVGLATQFVNTGLVGYVRGDYRNGENIEGWGANAGLRYSFAPEKIAPVMPTKAVQSYSQPTNWTGFYVGGFAGAAGGRDDIGYIANNPKSSTAGNSLNASNPWVAGGMGGIELGYNYQFANNWVVGIEADVGAGNVRGGRPAGMDDGLYLDNSGVPQYSGGFSSAFYTASTKSNWAGTVAGRLGYNWNRTLFYAKGGVAFAESSTSVDCIFGPTGTTNTQNGSSPLDCVSPRGTHKLAQFGTPSSVRVGYTLGLGAEFDIGNNWSVKSEYDWLSFARHNSNTDELGTAIFDKLSINQVKIGVNYKLGGL